MSYPSGGIGEFGVGDIGGQSNVPFHGTPGKEGDFDALLHELLDEDAIELGGLADAALRSSPVTSLNPVLLSGLENLKHAKTDDVFIKKLAPLIQDLLV
ncbi:MAG: hypothetical protein CL521_04885 [Actinobacteria bacterium]|nr:hypothetical protein [Actinomycetota bacterium]|tara:strand:+ start:478 stop:774 length:297 start_codon:yes stop_codon:yes gene_type:complete